MWRDGVQLARDALAGRGQQRLVMTNGEPTRRMYLSFLSLGPSLHMSCRTAPRRWQSIYHHRVHASARKKLATDKIVSKKLQRHRTQLQQGYLRLPLGAAGWPTLLLRLAELSSMITGGKGNSNARRQIRRSDRRYSCPLPSCQIFKSCMPQFSITVSSSERTVIIAGPR